MLDSAQHASCARATADQRRPSAASTAPNLANLEVFVAQQCQQLGNRAGVNYALRDRLGPRHQIANDAHARRSLLAPPSV